MAADEAHVWTRRGLTASATLGDITRLVFSGPTRTRAPPMYTFLIILLILDSVVLVVAILLQAGKGGGLAASFGGATSASDSLIGTRQAGNLLTKTSWTAGGIFLLLAFVLQIASARSSGAPASVLDKSLSAPVPAAPVPSTNKNSAVPLEAAPKAPAGAQPTPPAGTQPITPAPATPPAPKNP